MRVVIESEHGGFKVLPHDGGGWLWTPDPERALVYVRELVERFIASDLAVRRDGVPNHIRIFAGRCPTCGLGPEDCVGREL